jgi:hypothetical protein
METVGGHTGRVGHVSINYFGGGDCPVQNQYKPKNFLNLTIMLFHILHDAISPAPKTVFIVREL